MELLFPLVIVAGVVCWLMLKMFSSNGVSVGGDVNAVAAQNGATLTYQYKNLLGIDVKGERIVCVYLLKGTIGKNEIRSIEKSSIFETKVGSLGKMSHKDKNCKLIIHTRSLEEPMITVPFSDSYEMDEWYSRLSNFCGLS